MAYKNMTPAEYSKKRYYEFAAAGLCHRCGNPPLEGKTSCQQCWDRFTRANHTISRAEYQRHWRKTDKGRISAIKAMVKWRKHPKNKAVQLANAGRYRRRLRFEVMSHYGDRCVCCGETNMLFLSLDHINNDGKAERLAISNGKFSSGGANFFRHVRRSGYPKHLQLLCFNCNHAKAFYGSCPHATQASLSPPASKQE